MRTLATLALGAILIGSACGSAPPEQKVEAASSAALPLRVWWHLSSTTTTTAAPQPRSPAPSQPAAPVTVPMRPAAPRVSRSAGGGWDALKNCEAGGNYNTNTGNGFYGAYQFDRGTWNANNVAGGQWGSATPEQQDAAARHLYSQRGASPWPVCGRHLR